MALRQFRALARQISPYLRKENITNSRFFLVSISIPNELFEECLVPAFKQVGMGAICQNRSYEGGIWSFRCDLTRMLSIVERDSVLFERGDIVYALSSCLIRHDMNMEVTSISFDVVEGMV